MVNKKQTAEPVDSRTLWRYIAWALLAGGWALLVAALAGYDPADISHSVAPHNAHIQNWVGRFGAVVAYKTYLMIGPGIWVLMTGWLAMLVTALRGKRITQPALRITGVVMMSLTASAILGLGLPSVWNSPEGAGGLIAIYVNRELTLRFATLGAMLLLAVTFWLGAILAADQVVLALPKLIARGLSAGASRVHIPNPVLVGRFPRFPRFPLIGSLWPRRHGRDNDLDFDQEEDDDGDADARIPVRRNGRAVRARNAAGAIDENAGGLGATESFDPDAPVDPSADKKSQRAAVVDEVDDADEIDVDDEDDQADDVDPNDETAVDEPAVDAPGAYVAQKKRFDPDELRAKIKQLPIKFTAAPVVGAKAPVPREIDLSGYQFPGMDLLIEPESSFNAEIERLVRDQAVQLESAMQQYRIEGEVVGIDSGPVITLYEVRLAPGTKVAQISAIASDLARALRAHNIRVVPNMAGKDTIGVEVPNLVKEKVRLKELMSLNPDKWAGMQLPMFLAKDASGNALIADLATMPHMLIAGTTGSGKSVCMNSIIMSFLYTKRPDELKLVLVDPKMVEMSMFKDIPHLMCPVVTEMTKATAILEWATTKMDERYELLAEAGVRDVASYNSLKWEELKERFNPQNESEEAHIPKKLPYLVFVIDELADLMMTNKEVEGFIVRLAQKSRAVGMHLILATQRPQANVVTGLIKSNMPCRVSFKVASGMDSRIVLDQKGAELLLGQGDMLYLSPRSSKLTRAQGTLVDDGEIRKAVRFLNTVSQQNFEPQLVQIKGPGALEDDAERDPLFDQAVEVVLETQRGSVSLLQRRLTIGYSRASRLIEQMAGAGLLGDYKGSQAREVTITLDEWEALKAQAQADAANAPTDTTTAADTEPIDEDEAIEVEGQYDEQDAPIVDDQEEEREEEEEETEEEVDDEDEEEDEDEDEEDD